MTLMLHIPEKSCDEAEALQQSSPERVAGGVDDRLQVVVHGHQLRWRTCTGVRLGGQRLAEHHFETLEQRPTV